MFTKFIQWSVIMQVSVVCRENRHIKNFLLSRRHKNFFNIYIVMFSPELHVIVVNIQSLWNLDKLRIDKILFQESHKFATTFSKSATPEVSAILNRVALYKLRDYANL
jgi:predicted transglutaminase-like protease